MCSPLSEVTRGRVAVGDGTVVPTGNRAGQTGLYVGKKRRHGANIQILPDLDGALLAVSAPLPGSVHDRPAIAASGWESSLASTPTLGDLADQGTFVVTPSRKPPRRQLSRGSEVTNRHHARLRAPWNAPSLTSRTGKSSPPDTAAASPSYPTPSPPSPR